MKAIVENLLGNMNWEAVNLYVTILNIVASCQTEKELRERMKLLAEINNVHKFFNYGFGHNHFWVCKANKERLIFVEF